jgi:serine/threonine protein kinase
VGNSALGKAEEAISQEHPSCPDAGQLVEYARGTLVAAERASVEVHIGSCAECSEVLHLWTGSEAKSGISDQSTGSMAGVQPATAYPPGPGDILAEKYRVERVLGIGGMGVVVAATHLQLGRVVALKLMLPRAAASAETAARFVQEARAAAEVQSEHVARVLDVGTLEDGAPFMVMEYLRGSDFARILRAHGPLPIVDVAGYVLQACEAVAEAHALGIVHRDLKPANLFLTTRADGSPLVKVLDFGISKLTRTTGQRDVSLTKSRTVMGTPLYMSPEQLRSTRSVGPGTDIWSLGCILYELLSARPAFQADSAEALGALIATGPAPRVRDVRPEVPRELEGVILRCLEKDPAARHGSVGELAREIGRFAPGDMTPLVERVARISRHSARPEGQLPFADTLISDRPPPFSSATAGTFARSDSTRGRPTGARARWVLGGGLALAASVLLAAYLRPSNAAAPAATAGSPSASQERAAASPLQAPASAASPADSAEATPSPIPPSPTATAVPSSVPARTAALPTGGRRAPSSPPGPTAPSPSSSASAAASSTPAAASVDPHSNALNDRK